MEKRVHGYIALNTNSFASSLSPRFPKMRASVTTSRPLAYERIVSKGAFKSKGYERKTRAGAFVRPRLMQMNIEQSVCKLFYIKRASSWRIRTNIRRD